MAIEKQYLSDVAAILSHRHDNGADLWATPDNKLLKGSPFSTFDSVLYLLELGMSPQEPVLKAAADLIFSAWQEDGRFRIYPTGGIYPCQTAIAANVLCHMGYAEDERLQKTFQHFLDIQYKDGGWRCNKFSFGHGEETEYSNPQPTLKPIGPCHYRIGTLFMQVEYPFRNYNLFQYVYVLSFYGYAKNDRRFLEAFETLKSKTVEGKIVVERVVPKLAKLSFCRKGFPSELATRRYSEILENLNKGH